MSYWYDWSQPKFLGSGSFGQVWKVDRFNKLTSERNTVAFKIIEKSSDGGLTRTELKALKELAQAPNHHENIVQFYGYYESPSHSHFEFEYVEGDLYEKMWSIFNSGDMLPVDTIAWIALETLKGLEYMHKKRYVHCDIKPENILISHDFHIIKIADFGLTTQLPIGRRYMEIQRIQGTYDYASPEVFEKTLAYASDIWSLGVTIFTLCYRGQLPFCGAPIDTCAVRQQEEARYMHVKYQFGDVRWHQEVDNAVKRQSKAFWKGSLRNPILWPEKAEAWGNKYKDARQFIERLLQKDHKDRCSAAKALKDKFIRRALPHPHNEHHRQAPQPQYQHQSKRQYSQYQPQPQPQPQPLALARPQSKRRPLWQPENIPQQQFLQAPQQGLSASGYASNRQQPQPQNHFGQSYSAHSTGWGQNQSGLGYGKRKMTDPMRWQPKKPSLLKSLVQGVMPKRYPQGIPTHIPRPPSKLRKSRWK